MGLFKKKTDLDRIKGYFNKGFKKEIRDLEDVRTKLEGIRKDYKKSKDLDWKTAFDEADDIISENEREVLSFMETYDFLRRPETQVVRNFADSSREALEELLNYSSAAKQIPSGADGISAYRRSFMASAGEISDPAMEEKLRTIDGLLDGITERIGENVHHDQFRKLESYYLPTMETLLSSYVDVQRKHGSNIDTIKTEAAAGADTLIEVLNSLYNDSYGDMAIDMATESSVMKKVATRDGLLKNTDFIREEAVEDRASEAAEEAGSGDEFQKAPELRL